MISWTSSIKARASDCLLGVVDIFRCFYFIARSTRQRESARVCTSQGRATEWLTRIHTACVSLYLNACLNSLHMEDSPNWAQEEATTISFICSFAAVPESSAPVASAWTVWWIQMS